MISFDIKSETASPSPLSLSTPSDKPKISFSDLLRGVSENKDTKQAQNGSLILSLNPEDKVTKSIKGTSKTEALLSLLKNKDALPQEEKPEPLELNPKIIATLSKKEIKTLVSDAKDYLKSKIENSDDYKRLQIKELPTTLKGLVEVAKKIGIDISKITIEEVKTHANANLKSVSLKQEDAKTIATKDVLQEKSVSLKQEDVKSIAIKDTQEKKTDTSYLKEVLQGRSVSVKQEDVKSIATKDTQEKKVEVTSSLKEALVEKNVSLKQEDVKTVSTKDTQDKKAETSNALKHIQKESVATTSSLSQKESIENIKDNEKITDISKEIKATPLFKTTTAVEHTSTEQLVQAKVNSSIKVEQKTPKEKADETLKLLLRGEKPSMTDTALTADFSVATAKVIAPSAISENSKLLEKLLHGDSLPADNSNLATKTEGLSTHKSDSFELKLNEAKQMIKYLSADVKTAIDDYKSPFTRVKIQLNPQNLGEVDLTIVQRGKNLHVNISSNTTAINTLSVNANELRVQLNNSGINNATLNFNNSSQNSDANAGQQHQQKQNGQQAREEYNYFEKESANEEVLSSLEIIVPHYA